MVQRFRLTATVLMILISFYNTFAEEGKWPEYPGWEEGALSIQSNNGRVQAWFDIRMYLDGAVYFEEGPQRYLSNGTDLRRGRFSVKTRFYQVWRAEWDVDLAPYIKEDDKKDDEAEIKDMWLSYEAIPQSMIKIGQHKPPFSLEELTSSRILVFMERAYPNVFASDRRLGLSYTGWIDKHLFGFHHNIQLAFGVFGENVAGIDKKTADDGYAFAGRLTYGINSPDLFKTPHRLHIGASLLLQTPDAVEDGKKRGMDFDVYPETRISRIQFLDTDDIYSVKHNDVMGLESVFSFGPVFLQGEYIKSQLIRTGLSRNVRFDGGYAFLSWMITGEHKPYLKRQGEFYKPAPKRSFGAIEFALRYSHLNLSDVTAGVFGGKANNYTIAVNWYVNTQIRFMLNYVMVDNSVYADAKGEVPGGNYDFSFLALRTMVTF